VLDDHWWPSVAAAARYFERDLGWRVVPGAFGGDRLRARRRRAERREQRNTDENIGL